jgi:amino acid transporter
VTAETPSTTGIPVRTVVSPGVTEKPHDDGLKREAGLVGLLFTSEGSIIGSGWLFGALAASQIGGPAAIIAWVIGSVAMLLLALIHAELGPLFPVSGGTARFPHYAFGGLAGASFGWFSWLQAAGTAPIETEAALQYASNYAPWLTHDAHGTTVLTGWGFLVGALLLGAFTLLNFYGVKKLTQANNAITTWKIAIPVLTIIVLLCTHFHASNFTSHGFAPFGARGVLEAISAGGAVFALVGFEQAVQLGGESANPKRDLPRAVIGSILIGGVIYLMLQIVFIGALPASSLRSGWAHLIFTNSRGPFAGIALGVGLSWLAYVLYTDAIISPGGSSLVYLTTASRLTYAMAKNGSVPAAFEKSSERTRVPVVGLLFAYVVSLILFLPFPGWETFVSFITSATVLMYAGAPLALGALRHQKPNLYRPFRLPMAKVLAPAGFIVANLIIYWGGWTTDWKLYVAVLLGYVLMVATRTFHANPRPFDWDWKAAIWLWPYLAGMALISYLGEFGGAANVIPLWWDIVVVAGWSLVVYYVALSLRLPESKVDEYVSGVYTAED